MNFTALIDRVSQESGLPKTHARKVIQGIVTAITEAAANNQAVSIRDLGKFTVSKNGPRAARNPRTGEDMVIPASRRLRFSAARVLRAELNGKKDRR